MKHLSDVELMILVKEGNFSAFDEIYGRYHSAVYSFLFSLTWDQETAEDHLQEVFLRLYRARGSYEPTGKFSTYIFQIAKNYYLAKRRRKRPKEVSLEQVDAGGFRIFDSIRASQKVEPEVHLLEEYRRWQIRRAIASLPEGQKLVFVMARLHDVSYSEIAEVLRVPVGTVKSRMFNAVSKLRILLKEEDK